MDTDLRATCRIVMAIAGERAHALAVPSDRQADALVLDLVEPARTGNLPPLPGAGPLRRGPNASGERLHRVRVRGRSCTAHTPRLGSREPGPKGRRAHPSGH